MKVILINVISLDGKITQGIGKNSYEWSSAEDFANFKRVVSQNNLIVMGSETFDNLKDNKKAGLKPEKERLRIILTRDPKKYSKFFIHGQMEFTSDTPKNLIARLEKLGYKKMMLVSGGQVSTSFFKAKLIDEIWLTIEPRIFGIGNKLVQDTKLDIQLKLLNTKKLNNQGALLLKYKVLK